MRFEEPAYQLAQKGLHLFLQEWQGESHIHENYNTLTGDGDDRSEERRVGKEC